MPLCYDSLPGQLLALLQAGHRVTVRWDCGSDEHLVFTEVDGVQQDFDFGPGYDAYLLDDSRDYDAYLAGLTNLPLLLGGYLTEQLGLPSVGEFSLWGGGRILLEAGALVLEFQSEAERWDDVPEPADWTPAYFLSPAELAELFPERLGEEVGPPGPVPPQPDPALAAAYTGRMVLFQLA